MCHDPSEMDVTFKLGLYHHITRLNSMSSSCHSCTCVTSVKILCEKLSRENYHSQNKVSNSPDSDVRLEQTERHSTVEKMEHIKGETFSSLTQLQTKPVTVLLSSFSCVAKQSLHENWLQFIQPVSYLTEFARHLN
jgi:hypothetical protein